MQVNITYQLAPMPEDYGIPPFLRGRVVGEYTFNLIERVQAAFSAHRKLYAAGQDGILVSIEQQQGLKDIIEGFRINGRDVKLMPTQDVVDGILALASQEVQEWAPEGIQNGIMERLSALKPKYAGSLEEAAAALGLDYKP